MANDANLFEFKNDTMKISYSTESFFGPPLFTYQEGKISISTPRFQTNATALGALVTMVIELVTDAFTRDVSLIVPHVHLDHGKPADVETLMIFSTTKSSIGGPDLVMGQITTYRAVSVKGKASRVMF